MAEPRIAPTKDEFLLRRYIPRIRTTICYMLLAAAAALAVAACGGGSPENSDAQLIEGREFSADEQRAEAELLTRENGPVDAAIARIPMDTPENPYDKNIPEPILIDFLDCAEANFAAAGREDTLPFPGVTPDPDDVEFTIYSDCALASGIGEYLDIAIPPTPEEQDRWMIELATEDLVCLELVGVDPADVPMTASEFGFGEVIDFDAAIEAIPDLDALFERCSAERDG